MSDAPATPVTTALRLPPHPRGWSWRLLDEVARPESGHTPSRRIPGYWDGGSVPWLSLGDIRFLEGKRIFDTREHPTMDGIDHSSARLLPKNTVALCRTASVGKVVVLGREMATSQDFVAWVCGPQLDPDYLYWALVASQRLFDREKQGSTHKTIYMPTIERFRVLLPPLAEQRRIAEILDRAADLRRKRRESVQLAEKLAQATFLHMFGDPITNPMRWPTVRLDTVTDIASGITKGRKLPEGGTVVVAYMRVANVQDGHISLDDVKTIEVSHEEIRRYRLLEGDVLLTEGGDPDKLGRGAVWHGEIDPCIHQNHIFRVRCVSPRLLPEFASAVLGSELGKRYFLRAAKQTTESHRST
ncbi:MAG: restriction endonuclease subunit S [Deltaproteobacteria bacterium]|nr:restriction endonuclease subunit S [Deltaproteobacteria bacterium]